MPPLLLFLLLVTPAVVGQTPELPCLAYLAFAGGETDGVALSTKAYADLFEALGENVSGSTLRKIIEGGDPFAPLEQEKTDLHSLNQQLTRFKALLEKREWNSAAVRAALIQSLVTRVEKMSVAESRRRHAVRVGGPDLVIALPRLLTQFSVSPDGKWLAIRQEDKGNRHQPWSLSLHDVEGGTTNFAGPDGSFRWRGMEFRPTTFFSPDSRSLGLVAAGDDKFIVWVPLEKGQLLWDKTTQEFPRLGNFPGTPAPWENPNYLYPSQEGGSTLLRRRNLITGESETGSSGHAALGFAAGQKVRKIGSVPNSPQSYVIVTDATHRGRILLMDFAPERTAQAQAQPPVAVKPPVTIAQWDNPERIANAFFNGAGEFITEQGRGLYKWPTLDSPVKMEGKSWTEGLGAAVFADLGSFPHKNEVALMYGSTTHHRHVEIVDTVTGKSQGSTTLPDHTEELIWLNEGETLAAKTPTAIHLIHFRRKLKK